VLALGAVLGAAQAQGPRTIVFFGDSLTAGYGLADPDTQSYPALIQGKIDAEHLPWHVVNAGLSGETSAGGLRRVDWVLRQRVDVFVLELGGNDGLPASMGQDYAEAFGAVFPALAAKNGLVSIPFLLQGVAERPDLNQGDMIHPTAAGDAVVADLVWKTLSPILASR